MKTIVLTPTSQKLLSEFNALEHHGKLTQTHHDILIQLLAIYTFREVVFLTGVKRGTLCNIVKAKRQLDERNIPPQALPLKNPANPASVITYIHDATPVATKHNYTKQ